jgi:hypothetical protein
MPLVAIASSDGVIIDGQLDTACTFHIYRFDGQGGCTFAERRSILRQPHCEHLPLIPQAAALLLADVCVILAAGVPKETAIFLRTRGIMAFAVQGEVSQALDAYSRRGRLLDNLFAHVRGRFRHSTRNHNPLEER